MKRFLLAPALLLLSAPLFATDVGVSVSVDRPGFYGSIDIGDFRPRTVNVQPIIVQPVVGVVQPMYMHVPPGHARKWSRYCHEYQACGRPVYFVQEEWYEREYKPRKHGGKHVSRGGHGNGNGKGHGNGKGRHD